MNSRDADEGAGGANVAKKLAMRARRFPPAVDVDQHHARSNRIFEAPARVLDRPAGDREACLCLLVDVALMDGLAVSADRGGSGHGQTGAGTDRARESDRGLKRRA